MLLSLLLGGFIFLVPGQGQLQKKNCNIDPAVIFFENEELETIRSSFQSGGDCSPHEEDYDVNNDVQGAESDDRKRSDGFINYQRFPDIQKPSNGFLDSSRSIRHQEDVAKRRIQNRRNPFGRRQDQLRGQPVEFSRPIRTPQNQFNPFSFNGKTSPQNGGRPDEFFGNFFQGPGIQGRPDNFFLPNNRRSQSGGNDLLPGRRTRPMNRANAMPSQNGNGRKPQNGWQGNNPFMLDGQRRRQFFGHAPENIFTPNTPRQSNSNARNSKQVTERPQRTTTTTVRPETTTMGGGPPPWATPPNSCVRSCANTPEYNPICGTDKVTYMNPGRLQCEQRCGKATQIGHYGVCVTSSSALPRPDLG